MSETKVQIDAEQPVDKNVPARADLSPGDRRTIDNVRDICLDAATLDVTIAAALNQLDQSLAGYPATTPGASPTDPIGAIECSRSDCSNIKPCPIHDVDEDRPAFGPASAIPRQHHLGHVPAEKSTPTERLVGQRDAAGADRQELHRLIKRIQGDISDAAALSQRWGTSGANANTVRQRLADALSSIWCDNCAENGFDRRRTNGDYCEFCSGIKSKYKRYPNHQLCAMNAAGRRVMPSDVARAFKNEKARDTVDEEPLDPDSTAAARDRRHQRLQGSS